MSITTVVLTLIAINRTLCMGPLTGRPLKSVRAVLPSAGSGLSRRELLASSLAAASAAAFPNQAFAAGSPRFIIGENAVSVMWNGATWSVDAVRFGGHPQLFAKQSRDCLRGSLRGALFAQTSLAADLDFAIDRRADRGWTFALRIPSLGLEATTDLAAWLVGKTRLQLPLLDPFQVRLGDRDRISGVAATIDSRWTLVFASGAVLCAGTRQFRSDQFAARLVTDGDDSAPFGCRISAASADLLTISNWIACEPTLLATADAAAPLHIEYTVVGPKAATLVIEPCSEDSKLDVIIKLKGRGRSTIKIQNYKYAEITRGRNRESSLAGDIAPAGSDLQLGRLRYSLAGGVHGPFLVEMRGSRIAQLRCVPAAVASELRIEGGIASRFEFAHPVNIEFSGPGASNVPIGRSIRVAQAQTTRSDADALLGLPGALPFDGRVACSGCDTSAGRYLPYFSTRIVRPEDLLSLGFEFYNFEVKSDRRTKYLAPIKNAGPALVIVHFPSQHILEDAYNEDLGCTPTPQKIRFPIGAEQAGPSRLVFEFPSGSSRLNLSLDALTNWSHWKIRKVPDRRHSRLIRKSQWDETSIEAPTKMFIQPGDATHWRSKKFEGAGQSRYALFHTELRSDFPSDPTEKSGERRARFVPIWTSDFQETGVEIPDIDKRPFRPGDWLNLRSRISGLDPLGAWRKPGSAACTPSPKPAGEKDRSTPLTQSERREIVRLSHDSTICATPPAAKYLILSARGAFADIEGVWPQTKARSCANISLEKWHQIFTEGQDQKITIQKRGLLYPFGHRVIYVKDTNRKIHFQDDAFYAVEKTTYFLIIRQRTVRYDKMRVGGDVADQSFQFPFRTLTITEAVSPNLDEPDFVEALKDLPTCLDAFWPTRCDKLWEANFIGKDWAGNDVQFKAPMLWVQDTADPQHVPAISSEYLEPTKEPPKREQPDRRDLAGQLVALAPSFTKGDTEVDALLIDLTALAQNLKYGPFCPPPDETVSEEELCKILDYGETELSAPFHPAVAAIEARLPSLSRATSSGGGEMWLEITDPKHQNDPMQAFAIKHLDDGLNGKYRSAGFKLPFNAEGDRSGGVSSPTPNINALSRVKGPIGLDRDGRAVRSPSIAPPPGVTLATLGSRGLPSPGSFFDKLDAKILGTLPVRDLLSELGLDLSMPSLANFLELGADTADVTGYVYDWDTDKLKDWPGGDFGFQFLSTDSDGTAARLTITGGAMVELQDEPKVVGFISGALTNFRMRLVFVGNGIEAPFNAVRFYAPLGEKINFDVDIGDIKFIGPLMEFADTLKQFLGLGDGYDIDVTYQGVKASIGPFALPSIGLGVFSISNIGFSASCNVYFRGNRPVTFGFGFSSFDMPFTLAVAFLAGRGHFRFDVDTGGIQRIEASLEFGAFAELAFGGVAHGYLYVMGGVFYSSARVLIPANRLPPDSNTTLYETQLSLEIYVRFGGGLKALGFISITVDVHLGLHVVKRGTISFAEGTATCTYSVEIGFFKKSFSVTYSRTLEGSNTASSEPAPLAAPALVLPAANSKKRARKRSTGAPPSCADAIGKSGFREYWYAYEGSLVA
jgi:hypothetical protein